MAPIALHKQEKEQFIKLFKQDRIDRFDDRLTVLEIFLRTEHHVTVAELTALIQQADASLTEEFVHETIELICQYGFAQRNPFDNGVMYYEHRHLGQHHDHMICTKCRKIIEFENQDLEHLQEQIASAYGFHMLQHKMELYGICSDCLAGRERLIALSAAKTGERLIIKGFIGGTQSRLRLLTMGLRIGDCVEVINNVQNGQIVLAVDFKRLVLGRGMAEKIQASPVRAAVDGAALTQSGSE